MGQVGALGLEGMLWSEKKPLDFQILWHPLQGWQGGELMLASCDCAVKNTPAGSSQSVLHFEDMAWLSTELKNLGMQRLAPTSIGM